MTEPSCTSTPGGPCPGRPSSTRQLALRTFFVAMASVGLVAAGTRSAARQAAASAAAPVAAASAGHAPTAIPRFDRPATPIALAGPVRPAKYVEASGRRAAFLGREDGSFEAWAYPLKIAHDIQLAFQTPAYAQAIPGAELATSIDVRPEGVVIRYTHASFTVDATWLVPLDAPGGLVLLDVDTSVPLTIAVRFRPDLKPMWPAALGGQYSYWDDDLHAYVIGEASRTHTAIVGSPFALAPPEQPAHNLPDAPSAFTMAITPEQARAGLIPIALVAMRDTLDAARAAWQGLLADPGAAWAASANHYARLRTDYTTVDTPDDTVNLALEWGKVALDKGFVCNPDLGCGLLAGLGPSGTTERPGFGWFFGGDAFMNTWAMEAYGDHDTVARTLQFFAKYQRADGKLPHEISQGAGYLRWFEAFPYAYYHGDTTPLFVSAAADYLRASGDVDTVRTLWPAVRRAFEYCMASDADGDGLMDNAKAGLAAVETGTLRTSELLTDVYLAGAWTDAAAGAADLGTAVGDEAVAGRARAAFDRARQALNRRFGSGDSAIPFALMKDGSAQGASTVWPALGVWRGHFDATAPAVRHTLDELAGPGVGADWGGRMVTRTSPLYDPVSYNNGAVWPFVSGFATLALYRQGRSDAAWQYLDALARLAFIESRGYTAELFSGDRLRTVDAAVPHQLFATSGFVSGLLRGLVGWDDPAAPRVSGDELALRPTLPAAWDDLSVQRLRWRKHLVDLQVHRSATDIRVRVTVTPGPLPVSISLPQPAGATPEVVTLTGTVQGMREWRVRLARPGLRMVPHANPLQAGAGSGRLRIIDVRTAGDLVAVDLAGLRGRDYIVDLVPAVDVGRVTVRGATIAREPRAGEDRTGSRVRVRVDAGDGEWGRAELVVPRP